MTEIYQGAPKCVDGSVPLCSDKEGPTKCNVGVAVEGWCSDDKPPTCADGKQPTTCNDGIAPVSSEVRTKIEIGQEVCSDGKMPACSADNTDIAKTCMDKSVPKKVEGAPFLCEDSSKPLCVNFLPASTCSDGAAPKAEERIQEIITDE